MVRLAFVTSVNALGFFHITRWVICRMLAQDNGGHIINVTSTLADHGHSAVPSALTAMTKGGLVAVTASFGVAAFPDAPTPAALFASADEALYRAKHAGKNCVVSADAGTIVRAHE